MESQPQNPEFRMNPENFHPWEYYRLQQLVPNDHCSLSHHSLFVDGHGKPAKRHGRYYCQNQMPTCKQNTNKNIETKITDLHSKCKN